MAKEGLFTCSALFEHMGRHDWEVGILNTEGAMSTPEADEQGPVPKLGQWMVLDVVAYDVTSCLLKSALVAPRPPHFLAGTTLILMRSS